MGYSQVSVERIAALFYKFRVGSSCSSSRQSCGGNFTLSPLIICGPPGTGPAYLFICNSSHRHFFFFYSLSSLNNHNYWNIKPRVIGTPPYLIYGLISEVVNSAASPGWGQKTCGQCSFAYIEAYAGLTRSPG